MPFGFPQRKKVAALSLCSSFCEVIHFQILCSHFKKKCEHERRTQRVTAKAFAECDAPRDRRNFKQDENENFLLCLPAARGGKTARDGEKAFMFFS